MRSRSHRWNEVRAPRTWFAAISAISDHESFIVWEPQTGERPPLAGYRGWPRYKSFASAASSCPSIRHGYLGAASLSEAYINDTLGNEDLHAISIFSIMRGLVSLLLNAKKPWWSLAPWSRADTFWTIWHHSPSRCRINAVLGIYRADTSFSRNPASLAYLR